MKIVGPKINFQKIGILLYLKIRILSLEEMIFQNLELKKKKVSRKHLVFWIDEKSNVLMMKLVGLNASTIADKEIKKDAVIGCEEQNKIHVLPNLYEFVVEKEQLQQVQPQPKEEEKKER